MNPQRGGRFIEVGFLFYLNGDDLVGIAGSVGRVCNEEGFDLAVINVGDMRKQILRV